MKKTLSLVAILATNAVATATAQLPFEHRTEVRAASSILSLISVKNDALKSSLETSLDPTDLSDLKSKTEKIRQDFYQLGAWQAAEELGQPLPLGDTDELSDLEDAQLLSKATEVLGGTANDQRSNTSPVPIVVPGSWQWENDLRSQVELLITEIDKRLAELNARTAAIRFESGFSLLNGINTYNRPQLRLRLSSLDVESLISLTKTRQQLLTLRRSVQNDVLRILTEEGAISFVLEWISQDLFVLKELVRTEPEWQSYENSLQGTQRNLETQLKALQNQEEALTADSLPISFQPPTVRVIMP